MSKYIFDRPRTIQEAKLRIAALRGEILDHEAQLGDREKKGKDGVLLTRMAYAKWRQKTKWSMRVRGEEIDYLQWWITKREANQIEGLYRRMRLDPENPESLLAANYRVLRSLARERRVTLDEEEQVVVDATSRYFGPILTANGKVVPPKEPAVTGGDSESTETPAL